MRRLTLHASALNDEEYNLYTTSLADLVFCDSTQHDKNTTRGDAFYEQLSVSVREVRAWLRGRYPDIPLERIDAILKLFSPALAQGDLFSGGQFFAVLRLVVHAQNGKEVDRGLAFVQAHPTSSTRSLSTTQPTSEVTSPQPSRRLDGYAASSASETALRPSTNPFSYDSLPQPPLHPSQRQDPSKSAHSPNNPFISRSKSISEDGSGRLPPLPPRKTSVQKPPPPRHASISSSTSAPTHPHTSASASTNVSRPPPPPPLPPHSSSSHQHPPLPPPPPPKLKSKPPNHVTSTLIKQSLQASKAAQTMKKAEEQLEKERVLQVLRSSAVVSGSNMTRSFGSGSRSPSKRTPVSQQSLVAQSDSSTSWSGGEERERPPLPRRRQRQQQQPSPPMSTSSLEQVALAVAPSGTRSHPHTPFTSSPFESPSNSPRGRLMLDLPSVAGLPPPTHPDRKPHGYSHQIPSTVPDEHSPSPISPFRRNLDSFEAIYGTDSAASSFSTPTPTTPTTTSDLTPSSSGSPQQRVYRSRSLHHHPPQSHAPPPPPARRRRPESVQVLSNGEVLFGGSSSPTKSPSRDSGNVLLKTSIAQSIQTPHRRSSYSASFSGSAPPSSLFSAGGGGNGNGGGGGADVLQRKFAELQMKAESALPMLEAARYKAEAGLSRRGFIQGSSHGKDETSRGRVGVKEDREGLMSGYSGDQYGREEDGVRGGGGLSVDSGDEECAQGRGEHKVVEQDALKWPAGEGWSRML